MSANSVVQRNPLIQQIQDSEGKKRDIKQVPTESRKTKQEKS